MDVHNNGPYILITGASSGIGRQTAITLSSMYSLILNGRDEERLRGTKAACCASEKHLLWPCELAETELAAQSLRELLEKHDVSVAGFVHAAGIAPLSPLRLLSSEQMQRIMSVNFYAAIAILQVLLADEAFKSAVLISSIQAERGAKGQAVYCASKGAIDAFVEAAAPELAPVCINSILPGAIPSRMGKTIEANEALLAHPVDEGYLLGLGEPQAIADMVAYLLSPKAVSISGQHFTVDGGKTAH